MYDYVYVVSGRGSKQQREPYCQIVKEIIIAITKLMNKYITLHYITQVS